MIFERKGDLFQNQHQAYAHGVSITGRMGAGIARIFRQQYPEMFEEYRMKCKSGELLAGDCFFYRSVNKKPSVFNLITQDSLDGAGLSYLENSLRNMYVAARENGINDIGMPLIGCGLGGLNRHDVVEMLRTFFRDSSYHVTVYRK